jgi:hypothetical protein
MAKELREEKKNIKPDDHPAFNETGEDRTRKSDFQ